MASCHDMKKDEIYRCEKCGLELQVLAECKDAGKSSGDCECHDDDGGECRITCCGHDLTRKP